jgi:hypothetical protein
MTLSSLKIISVFIVILIFASCNNSGRNEKQSGTDESKDTLSTQNQNTFLFLTEWFDKVGVYKYNLSKKKYSPVWWHPRENVVLLVYKHGGHPSYFLTSDKIGTRGNFPSFSRLKLFIISHDLSEIKQIDNIGDGMQFAARWNDDENLELIYTTVDKTIASYVNQYTKVYDHYGKLYDSGIKTFDIEKSGFPQLIPPRDSTISPSGKYGISFKSDSVFLKTGGTDTLEFIEVMKHNLNKLKWSGDEEYLFISSLNLNNETVKSKNPETSELFIYSLTADSLIGVFGGAGVKNFFTLGDLLIFDDGFGNNSVINIFDLNQKKIINVIKPKKGCALVFIPQL